MTLPYLYSNTKIDTDKVVLGLTFLCFFLGVVTFINTPLDTESTEAAYLTSPNTIITHLA
jgi:hypothetical protein